MVEYSKPIVMDDGNLYLPNHMIIGGIPLILKNQMNELLIPNLSLIHI